MLFSETLPFIKEFVEALDEALKEHAPRARGLSSIQRRWLGFCMMAISLALVGAAVNAQDLGQPATVREASPSVAGLPDGGRRRSAGRPDPGDGDGPGAGAVGRPREPDPAVAGR